MSKESSLEEGEILEDGEIPQEATSSGREAGEVDDSSRFFPRDEPRRKPTTSPLEARGRSPRGHRPHDTGWQNGSSKRDANSSGARERRAGGSGRPYERTQAHPGGLSKLVLELRKDLKGLSIYEANRHVGRFCHKLETAVRDLVRIRSFVDQSKAGEDLDFGDLAARVFSGIRGLQIVSTTGAGKANVSRCRQASEAVQYAARHLALFSAAHQKEFNSWTESNKVFGALLERGSPPKAVVDLPGARQTLPEAVQSKSGKHSLPQPPPHDHPVPLGADLAGKLARFQKSAAPGLLQNGRGPRPPPGSPPRVLTKKPSSKTLVGVPGLDSDTPRSSAKRERPEFVGQPSKRLKAAVDLDVSLEDDLDLYSGTPENSVPPQTPTDLAGAALSLRDEPLGALPPGIEDLLAEESAVAAVPNGTSSRPPMKASETSGSDMELDEEAARLFGSVENGKAALQQAVEQHLRDGKLCLVLDLDHTLLNSARWGEVNPEEASILEAHLEREEELPFEQRALFSIESIQMWTKLRPACRQLLAALADKFVMWIHTNGNRQYAAAISQLLDPRGELFGKRVIANSGVGGAADSAAAVDLIKRLDAQGLAGLDPISVIVDDTASVWPGHSANLLQVERYCYFPSANRQFGYNRASLLTSKRDESPEQGMLAVVQRVLLQIHVEAVERFRESGTVTSTDGELNVDVRRLLRNTRSQILRGVKILFSRLWRTDTKSEDAPQWQLAKLLGAECTTALDDSVTHVVTNTRYTEKVGKALELGKQVVSVRWLEGSSIMWARADERFFQVPA